MAKKVITKNSKNKSIEQNQLPNICKNTETIQINDIQINLKRQEQTALDSMKHNRFFKKV